MRSLRLSATCVFAAASVLTACKQEVSSEKQFGVGDNPVRTDSTNVAPGPSPTQSKSNEVAAPASQEADQLPK